MEISAKELVRDFGRFSDWAISEPVIITKNGRARLVLISVDEYERLRKAARPVKPGTGL